MPDSPSIFINPYKPGAGHQPPYLAGREQEKEEFRRLLSQHTILENMVLTGLRGVGKTVLLDTFKPIARSRNWGWVGNDLSESASVSEEQLSLRLITDLSVLTSSVKIAEKEVRRIGFMSKPDQRVHYLNFDMLWAAYRSAPGLNADKLKHVLEAVWRFSREIVPKGLVFAYDEAQNLSDHSQSNQYPLSMLLDVFQSIQRKDIPFMLVLTGLPTLFPQLVEARTFSERMFRVVFLDRLAENDTRDAILKPLAAAASGVRTAFRDKTVEMIVEQSGGYPYFIQFICREFVDAMILSQPQRRFPIPIWGILRKLDSDFFAGRWSRATDRQRELLAVIAKLETCDQEFTVQEIADLSRSILEKPFGPSQVVQLLAKLTSAGLVYKNRHGKYAFAVPKLANFIRRKTSTVGVSLDPGTFDDSFDPSDFDES